MIWGGRFSVLDTSCQDFYYVFMRLPISCCPPVIKRPAGRQGSGGIGKGLTNQQHRGLFHWENLEGNLGSDGNAPPIHYFYLERTGTDRQRDLSGHRDPGEGGLRSSGPHLTVPFPGREIHPHSFDLPGMRACFQKKGPAHPAGTMFSVPERGYHPSPVYDPNG